MADLRALVVGALLAGVVLPSQAVYRPINPPPGWTNQKGVFEYVRVGQTLKWVELSAYTNGSLNIGGRALTIPVGLKLAGNAARPIAGLVFGNPWVAGGIMVAQWLAENYLRWNEEKQRWETLDEAAQQSDGLMWRPQSGPTNQVFPTVQAACNAVIAYLGPPSVFSRIEPDGRSYRCYFDRTDGYSGGYVHLSPEPGTCQVGWYITKDGDCVEDVPYRMVDEPEFVDKMEDKQFTDPLLNELPEEWPIPVRLPKINPIPAPDGDPQPTYVPEGDPVPNPNYDPNQQTSTENMPYVQPGTNIIPANTNQNPWNVDVQPVKRPQETDEANPDVDRNPDKVPDGGTGGGGNQSTGKPQPDSTREAEQIGLCDQYPDILACTKLGQLSPVEIPRDEPDFSITEQAGFGPSAGVCPPPITVNYLGKQLEFKMDLLCQFADGIRPLVLAFAWLSAGLIFIGAVRRG